MLKKKHLLKVTEIQSSTSDTPAKKKPVVRHKTTE